MKAAEKGFLEVVAALLSKGALIDLRNKVIFLFLYYVRMYQDEANKGTALSGTKVDAE